MSHLLKAWDHSTNHRFIGNSIVSRDTIQEPPDPEESPLKFPCEFPIKAMGVADEGFEELVVAIVRRHAPSLGEGAVKSRASSGGKYLSVTCTITAESRAQLDAIYRDLTSEQRIKWAM